MGGKMEFTKDEELSPWNYGGFDILNAAGTVKADFSNSELLFSERGGIVFAGVPEGNALGKNLDAVGPLVTSVSVNVGPGGVETTYKMDLYTPKFGRLQGQKEKELQKFGRTRQQQIDERNKSLRGSIKKGMTGAVNISSELSRYEEVMEASKTSSDFLSDFEKDSSSFDMLIGSVNLSESVRHDGIDGPPMVTKQIGYDVAAMKGIANQEAMAALPPEVLGKAMKNTAGGGLEAFVVPSYQGISHPGGMASRGYYPESNYQEVYYAQDNAGEVRIAVPGLPNLNSYRNTSASNLTAGVGQGGFSAVGDGSMPNDSPNDNLGAAGGRDGTGGMLGGMGDAATS